MLLFLEEAACEDSLYGVGQMCDLFMHIANVGHVLLCVPLCPGPAGQEETTSVPGRKGWEVSKC